MFAAVPERLVSYITKIILITSLVVTFNGLLLT